MPFSINRFFDEFIGRKASFGFDVFSKDVMQIKEIQFEPVRE